MGQRRRGARADDPQRGDRRGPRLRRDLYASSASPNHRLVIADLTHAQRCTNLLPNAHARTPRMPSRTCEQTSCSGSATRRRASSTSPRSTSRPRTRSTPPPPTATRTSRCAPTPHSPLTSPPPPSPSPPSPPPPSPQHRHLTSPLSTHHRHRQVNARNPIEIGFEGPVNTAFRSAARLDVENEAHLADQAGLQGADWPRMAEAWGCPGPRITEGAARRRIWPS